MRERMTARQPHTTSTREQGSFCNAVCDCGWRGPARRARDRARADALAHTGDPAPVKEPSEAP